MNESRISGLYKLSIDERIAELERLGCLSSGDARELRAGRQLMSAHGADKVIENVVGVFGLPFAVAPNFIVNGRECIVPLVVEEPSIVAALSNAAALARDNGGFKAVLRESLLAGQIHIVGVADVKASAAALQAATDELLVLANDVHPRLSARGGGAREIEVRSLRLADGTALLAVHVLIDTCDAMGANLVNTVCESIAPRVAEICGGDVALRILSNLADRSVVTATVRYSIDALAVGGMTATAVRDGLILANDIAMVDPHRAATHNKGIMNGIDALAIATGNDWRAIEAGAHAYAARNGNYAALTRWSVDPDGGLVGEINVPVKAGIVGGTASSNSAAALGLAMTGVQSAEQLAELMAAVGLAQNFAALRALASSGIQGGHMRLHARSVAAAAGAPGEVLDEVVARLLDSGEVKSWKAAEILAELEPDPGSEEVFEVSSAGKIILFGEHAVVYGHHAVAIPIGGAVQATAAPGDRDTTLSIPDWGLQRVIGSNDSGGVDALINTVMQQLGVADSGFTIRIRTVLPPAMGLGASAAIAVAVTRAVALCSGIDVDDCRVNDIAYECEKLAHGTPSGIDNAVSCFNTPMLFRNEGGLHIQKLALQQGPPLVVGFSHDVGATREQVTGVRHRYELRPQYYDAVFGQINDLGIEGAKALQTLEYDKLGLMMNICHGLLNAIQVSTPDLEKMVSIARENGATGAKLTGAGGGGSMVALCPGTEEQVSAALRRAGYRTLQLPQAGEPRGD